MGTLSVVTRELNLGSMVDRYGEARLSLIVTELLATGIAMLAFIRPLADPAGVAAMLGGVLPWRAVALLPYLPLAIAVAFLPLGTAFTFPCVTSLLSRVISSKERGMYMGVQQTFGGVSRVLFPILFGFLYDRSSALPFLVSSAMVLFTVYLGLGMEAYARQDAKPAAA
jgi:nitrate/nitrite transporter NarK